MIVKRFFINFICIFIIVSCYGQEIDFDASYCYSHKNNFNFKIGDTVFSKCYEDMMKMPFESVICSTLDTLSEYLKKQDKNIALIIAASQGTSIEFYNKENNRITGSDWRNITFKRANFAKQYLQIAKKLTNKIVCYGIGLKPYNHYPKEWWKSMC